MAFSVTYTFSNGTTTDATQVNTNFTDVINATSDGTENFSINALTVAGAAALNGDVTLGNGSVDDITFTGSLASSIPIKTTFSYDVGSSTVGIKSIYFGSDDSGATGVRVIAGTVSSSFTLTLPEAVGTAGDGLIDLGGDGTLTFLEIMKPGDTMNIGLAAGTTTNSADSITIQGATAALSATNPGFVCTPGATAGQTKVFKVTADVTIDLTGATQGEAVDLTDYLWSVYAINDAGTLKWGVGSVNQHRFIDGANDVATASSCTSIAKVLVNSALSGTSNCSEIGWFKANYDHTGGAASSLWTVQTGAGDINLGPRPFIPQFFTLASSWTNSTDNGFWWRDGGLMNLNVQFQLTGTPVGTPVITLPGALTHNTARNNELVNKTPFNSQGIVNDNSTIYPAYAEWESTTTMRIRSVDAATGLNNFFLRVDASTPITFASADDVFMTVSNIPITGWD